METVCTLGISKEARTIREAVFCKEQGFENEFDDIDSRAYHVVLYKNGKAVATGRTFQEKQEFLIGRVAVIKEYRKQHLGKEIICCLENKIRELGGTKVRLSAQLQASGFYQKLGYQEIGEVYLDEHCPHITMEKEL